MSDKKYMKLEVDLKPYLNRDRMWNYKISSNGKVITDSLLFEDALDDLSGFIQPAKNINFNIEYSKICDGEDSKVIAEFEVMV